MFNFIHNILSKLYFTKPSVHYIQPKSLNLKFKNGQENNYFWLNLKNVISVQPVVEQVKEENTNSFLLKVNVLNSSGENQSLNISKFETRKEAENALNILVSKMYSPEKSLVKLSLVIFILVFIWGLAIDIFWVSSSNLVSAPKNTPSLTQTVPKVSDAEQVKMLEDLQRQLQSGQPQAPQEAPPVISDVPQNPAVENLLNGLGK